MKNCELAEFTSCDRAMPTTPCIKRDVREFFGQITKLRPTASREPVVIAFVGGIAELNIACLRHEPVDHPVKDDPVISALFGQGRHALHVTRCHIFEQVDLDHTVGLACDGDFKTSGLGHAAQTDERAGDQATHLRPPPF